jgi:UDP-N-acetylglucosamine 2-epimerase
MKIGLFLAHSWHDPHLEPLNVLLKNHHRVLKTSNILQLKQFSPAVMVVADAGFVKVLRNELPSTVFIHVCHGLISKNVPALHYPDADYICLPSQSYAERLQNLGVFPRKKYWITGMSQMDSLFKNAKPRKQRTRIVYAPTWNPELSSALMFGKNLVPLLRGDQKQFEILIKPHPHTLISNPEWIQMWRQMSQQYENVVLVDPPGQDLIPYLLESDIMVSDASSSMFHFLALNRPIILVDNPNHRRTEAYDPEGIEWKWRNNIADTCSDVHQVSVLLRQALTKPDHLQENRNIAAKILFGDYTDGQASRRIVEHIERLFWWRLECIQRRLQTCFTMGTCDFLPRQNS